MANCANITRRSIFKLAPAAVLAASGAIAAFSPLSLALDAPRPSDKLEEVLKLWRQLTPEQKDSVMAFVSRIQTVSKNNELCLSKCKKIK